MFKTARATLAAATIGAAGLGFGLADAHAQNTQRGLVNVYLDDTTIQVPLSVAANICDVNVNVLADQLDLGQTDCGADATATAVDQDSGGNGPNRQNGLVNIAATDTTLQIPIAVAANVCDVNVNVLARQLGAGEAACDAVADSGAEE